jgi:hypothetical protein
MTFRVGQRVVCVADDFPSRRPGLLPSKGEIYTVRSVYDEHFQGIGWRKAVLLHEIVNAPQEYKTLGHHEAGFLASRFRPLAERKQKTDISELLKLQDPANHKVLVGT